jgi:hydroxymethylbilane synthase
MAQARRVADLLSDRHPHMSIRFVEVVTEGDRDTGSDITELTEIGAFVTAVQAAVLGGRADLAVHSLKDLPVVYADGKLELAAFPERAAPFDVLVGLRLDELTSESTVGSGSPRRSAQLQAMRPDIQTTALRGNVDTRVRKVEAGEVDAAILAEAGLDRLGLSDRIAQRLTIEEMVPAPGQGALAVEAMAGSEAAAVAATIDDPSLRTLLTAERELLKRTRAGCRSALGAYASFSGGRLRMDLFVSDERGPRTASVEAEAIEQLVGVSCQELGL